MKTFDQYLTEKHDGDGDCMSAAAHLMMRFHSDFFGKRLKAQGSPVLVHALVRGRGSVAGLRFPHAWVEDGNLVIDQSNGNDIRMEKRVYYALGGIKPNEKGAYAKYAYSDMKKKLVSTGHYGPWDLDESLEESSFINSTRKIGKRKQRLDIKLVSFLKEDTICESRGINQDRVKEGAIMLRGKDGVIWDVVGYDWYPRYAVQTDGAKARKGEFTPPELPEYLKAVSNASEKIGKLSSATKGILLLKLQSSADSRIKYIGKFHTSPTAPVKIGNDEVKSLGYERAEKGGGEFTAGGLNAAHFLKGHRTGGRKENPLFFFQSQDELKNRILANMKSSNFESLKSKSMIAAVKEMIEGGATKFDWSKVPNIPITDRKKLGIFLVSELCFPFSLWGGKTIDSFPGLSKINYFAVPVSDTNPSIDSFIYGVDTDGKRVKVVVSSKSSFGSNTGARGSILPKLNSMANRAGFVPNNPFLKELLPYFVSSSKGINTIYPFAIEKVLKIKNEIPNPTDLHKRLSILFPGPRSSKEKSLSDADLKRTKMEVQAIQAKLRSGVVLPGLNLRYPPNTESPGLIGDTKLGMSDRQLLQPENWQKFGRYVSTVFCDFVVMGINQDSSDFKPADVWQLTLNNEAFVETGHIIFSAKKLRDLDNPKMNQGKNTRNDVVRTNTWVGMVPSK